MISIPGQTNVEITRESDWEKLLQQEEDGLPMFVISSKLLRVLKSLDRELALSF